jgi:hypothetical protein
MSSWYRGMYEFIWINKECHSWWRSQPSLHSFFFPFSFACMAYLDNMVGRKRGTLYKFSDCWLNSYWLWKRQIQSDMHVNCAWGNGKTKYQNQRATLENHIMKITRMVNWYLEMYTCGIGFMYTTWWTFWALRDRFWTSTEFVNNLPMFN